MSNQVIIQLQYPTKTPSANGYSYMCWGTNGETSFAEFRDWVSDAWVLNPGDVIISFVEIGRKAIP